MFRPVYLDHNATTALDDGVREAMLPWLGARFGNASSRHEYGRQARAAIDRARAQVAAAVNAHPTEVLFCASGSEANNLFIKGAAAALGSNVAGVAMASAVEHPCVAQPMRQLAAQGWHVHWLPVDGEGRLSADEAEAAILAQRPALVSVIRVHNETGVIQPVDALSAACRRVGAWLHTDAVQGLGKVALDFRALGVQGMTLSGHKLGGPLGAAALILDKRVELVAQVAGGGQERALRAGTENVAAIVGFGEACAAAEARRERLEARTRTLTGRIETAIRGMDGARIFGGGALRVANTVFAGFDGVDGETLVGRLDRAGFACASGSACSSTNPEPSASLLAMGVAPEQARTAIRISLGPDSLPDDVERFCEVLAAQVAQLRNLTALAV